MPVLEEIQAAVEAGQPRYTESLVKQALAEGMRPVDILEKAMLTAMRNAGLRYKQNESSIPQILTSARCMQRGMDVLKPYLERQNYGSLGKVILGTVEGDLHEIGKNMVAIMLRSAGFKVIDLGVDVSEKKFVQAVKDNPDCSIVCISCLLSTSMGGMRSAVRSLREARDISPVRIMVGGSPITQAFADAIGADAYTDNAVDAAEVAKGFML